MRVSVSESDLTEMKIDIHIINNATISGITLLPYYFSYHTEIKHTIICYVICALVNGDMKKKVSLCLTKQVNSEMYCASTIQFNHSYSLQNSDTPRYLRLPYAY